ncbi:MAG: glycosyltransferase [Chromatiaceae bacterium]|nr:glycosyltransferase [Chromatiaceae bacterium]
MAARPRILLISRNPPTGRGTGARIRAGMFLQALLTRCEVHLLVIAPELSDADRGTPLLQQCASLSSDPMDWRSRRRAARFDGNSAAPAYLWGALSSDPANALSLTRREGERLLDQLPCREFDAVFAIRLSMARVAQQLFDWQMIGARCRVFDLDDIESRLVARERAMTRANSGRAVDIARRVEQAKLARVERRLIRAWDQVYLCSEEDRSALARQLRVGNVFAVPNTCAPIAVAPPDHAVPPEILFVGSMRYAPNADAALFFCTRILPRLCEHLGETPVTRIVGAGPDERLRALNGTRGIEIVGAVERIEDCYQSAALVIAPIRFGGGTRIKIIEALAAGRPVVATALGAEGLGLRDQQDLLLADDAEAFAAACARVLRDPSLWHSLVANGRASYAARFAVEVVTEAFMKVFLDCVGGAGPE